MNPLREARELDEAGEPRVAVLGREIAKGSVPAATYRLQLSKDFGFRDARAVVGYLERLGVGCVYTSPILKARAGSGHGYDVADPRVLNPELGTEADFGAFADAARARGLGLLVDIVPNHMAASHENPFWVEVLEDGEASRHARFFDIDWRRAGGPRGRIVLPVLGEPYGSALEGGRLKVVLEAGALQVAYWDKRFPLDPKTLGLVLGEGDARGARARTLLERLRGAIGRLPGREERAPGPVERRQKLKPEIAAHLRDLARDPGGRAFLEGALARLNGEPGDPASVNALDALLRAQPYRLALWKSSSALLDYRRFFDISDLVGVRVEDPAVFEAAHDLVLRLVKDGRITGLRVDHVDGLRDPLGYLERLRARAGEEAFLVVEKILTGDERLPDEWPVEGTTGYEFLKMASGIFADPRGVKVLDELYARFTGQRASFEELVGELKARVLGELFPGELAQLARALGHLAAEDRHACDVAPEDLAAALGGVTASLSVYRTYVQRAPSPLDRARIAAAVAEARKRRPAVDPRAFDFVERVLSLELGPPPARELVHSWQQLTGPVMAKGLEDTALYVHTRLLSLNVIGGRRSRARSLAELHAFNRDRQQRGDLSLVATTTHDTKRSEDVQARINVLSELAEDWSERALRWSRWNEGHRRRVKGHLAPDPSEELLLYQTLLGAWPFEAEALPQFRERLERYLVKAAREAKVWTSWLSPDEEHEGALVAFTRAILAPGRGNRFRAELDELLPRVALHGALNALGQLVVKIGSPGVADVYQGSELWDHRLVDPDNRGPVDFAARAGLLADLEREAAGDRRALLRRLRAHWRDGRIKLFVTWQGLRFRRERRELFLAGEYLPLRASGEWRDHVVAFARRLDRQWALVLVPRLLARKFELLRFPEGTRLWKDAELELPAGAPRKWRNVFTGETVETGRRLEIARVFRRLPVALLEGTD